MALTGILPSKEELSRFCELLFIIGVDVIELPINIYVHMEELPEGKFILNVNNPDEVLQYPHFYRYVSHQQLENCNYIYEIQMNDVREIIKLKTYRGYREVRIVGLDDLMCHSYEKIMKEVRSALPRTMINFCPENTYGCASALALQWVLDYGMNITTSFAGSRDNAATEEVIMALRLSIRHKPNRDLTVLPQLTMLYEKFTNSAITNRKPIIGKNIFKVEAGIHCDGLQKNPATYEPYAPGSVGGKSEIVIGKHSGTRAVMLKITQLDLPMPEEPLIEEILNCVKNVCTRNRKSLTEEEFKKLVVEVINPERNEVYR